jgi:hypothetical protein
LRSGCSLRKLVQVVLPPARLPFPGDTAEHGKSVVGRAAVRLGIDPHVPVRLSPDISPGPRLAHVVDADAVDEGPATAWWGLGCGGSRVAGLLAVLPPERVRVGVRCRP